MTRDPAAQAVHERLEHLATTMSEPDLEAGWAALVAQLEPPVAPVVPLRRRPKPRRAIVLGVAAAMLIAGAAFAAVRHGGADGRPTSVGPVTTPPGRVGMGPHTHPPLARPRAASRPTPSRSRTTHHDGGTSTTGGSTSSGYRSGGASSASHHQGKTHTFHHDSSDDTDHGTGNDGTHNDNGQGNNAQGQDTQGNENGSSGGSGQDQSGSGQGSSNRGTDARGGGDSTSGAGHAGDHGSHNDGQGGGQGAHG